MIIVLNWEKEIIVRDALVKIPVPDTDRHTHASGIQLPDIESDLP